MGGLVSPKQDLEEVRAFAREAGETEELVQWDVGFWAERLRCTSYQLRCRQ